MANAVCGCLVSAEPSDGGRGMLKWVSDLYAKEVAAVRIKPDLANTQPPVGCGSHAASLLRCLHSNCRDYRTDDRGHADSEHQRQDSSQDQRCIGIRCRFPC